VKDGFWYAMDSNQKLTKEQVHQLHASALITCPPTHPAGVGMTGETFGSNGYEFSPPIKMWR
jgi:hypothetical protein